MREFTEVSYFYSKEPCEWFRMLNLRPLSKWSCLEVHNIYEWGMKEAEEKCESRENKIKKDGGVMGGLWDGKREKLLNDETICSVKLLAHTSTNSKTSSMATSSVAKRETAISCNTPIFFSLMIPSPFPIYKCALIYQCESTKRYKGKTKTRHT